jgi:hypothetical protein
VQQQIADLWSLVFAMTPSTTPGAPASSGFTQWLNTNSTMVMVAAAAVVGFLFLKGRR